jgi:hypothetical protein
MQGRTVHCHHICIHTSKFSNTFGCKVSTVNIIYNVLYMGVLKNEFQLWDSNPNTQTMFHTQLIKKKLKKLKS